MIEEILELGITRLELGYDTRLSLLPGIEAMRQKGAVTIPSVHNYCPVPMGIEKGHPELWTFADLHHKRHLLAVQHTLSTMEYASAVGAGIVVIHCGYVNLRKTSTRELMDLLYLNQQQTPRYEKTFLKFMKEREKKAGRHLDQVCRALDALLPHAERLGICLGLENLPTLEAVPNEQEMEILLHRYQTPFLKTWHDLGHGQIRANLGALHHENWVQSQLPFLGGVHIHDVAARIEDHVMPPSGDLGLERFRGLADLAIPLVIEPASRATPEEIATGIDWLTHWWGNGPQPEQTENTDD